MTCLPCRVAASRLDARPPAELTRPRRLAAVAARRRPRAAAVKAGSLPPVSCEIKLNFNVSANPLAAPSCRRPPRCRRKLARQSARARACVRVRSTRGGRRRAVGVHAGGRPRCDLAGSVFIRRAQLEKIVLGRSQTRSPVECTLSVTTLPSIFSSGAPIRPPPHSLPDLARCSLLRFTPRCSREGLAVTAGTVNHAFCNVHGPPPARAALFDAPLTTGECPLL